jgi:hypothetical protein
MINMLHTNINFEWRWNHWPLSGDARIAKILVDELLPLTEYDHGFRFSVDVSDSSKLSILITLSTDDKYRRRTETSQDLVLRDKILPLVNHATVLVAKKNGTKLDEHLWFNIFLLGKALASLSPHLTTFRVIAQESETMFDAWATDSQDTRDLSTAHKFFPTLYVSLCGLPLRKGATQCSQLRGHYSHTQAADLRDNMNLQRPAHVRIDLSMCSNIVVKNSEWVYSSAENL